MTAPALLMRNTTGAHYAETYLASSRGTFRDADRRQLFDNISEAKAEAWQPGTVDAIATASADGRRVVATVTIHTISAAPTAKASLAAPDAVAPVQRSLSWSPDLAIELEPHSVAVVAITAR